MEDITSMMFESQPCTLAGFVCCACVEKRHVCLQLLLSKALSCHVQNFTIVQTYTKYTAHGHRLSVL